MADKVEIIQTPEGRLLAKASFEGQTFLETLPDDFATWTFPAQRQFLKSGVVPRLRFKVARERQKKLSSKGG